MRFFASLSLLAAMLCTSLDAQTRRRSTTQRNSEEGIYSRTVIHPDETRTVSKQDLNNKVREKRTLDKNGILLMRSIFQLNERGKAVNGLVYDGRNRLLYRSEFTYDNADRLQEERVFDSNGRPVRRLVYKPDRFGKMKPFALSFEDGRTGKKAGDFERYSTTSSHAYRGGTGVQNTAGAYRRAAAAPQRTAQRSSGTTARSSSSSRSRSSSSQKKRRPRLRIFRR